MRISDWSSDVCSSDLRGVEASVDGERYAVGGPALLRERSIEQPDTLVDWEQGWRERGATLLYLLRGEAIMGALALEDEIRPAARDAAAERNALEIGRAHV